MWNLLLSKLGLPAIEAIGTAIKNLFLGFMVFRAGEQKVTLQENVKEVKDAKEANVLEAKLDATADNILIEQLLNPTTVNDNGKR